VTNLQLDGNNFDCQDCPSISFLIKLCRQKDLVFYNSDNLQCKDLETGSTQVYQISKGFTHFCEQEIYPYILGVNFINILFATFLFKSVMCSFSLVIQFGFTIFWHKNICTKAAHKMLMKLFIGVFAFIFGATLTTIYVSKRVKIWLYNRKLFSHFFFAEKVSISPIFL